MSEVDARLTKVMAQLSEGFNPEPPEEKALPEQSGHLIEANDPNYPKKDSFIGKLGRNKVAHGVAGVVVAGGAMLATASHAEAQTPPQQEQTPLSSTIQKSGLKSVEPLITTIETTGVIGNTNTIDSSIWNVPQSEPVTVKTMAVEAGGNYVFANPAFEVNWNSIDGLTPAQKTAQNMIPNWYFGPTFSLGLTEVIEGKTYQVQYFDKTRMELQPDGTVTTGLLSTELIKAGANINVGGDDGSKTLTYHDLQEVSSITPAGENRVSDLTNQKVTDVYITGSNVQKGGYDGKHGDVLNVHYFNETEHNVSDIFLGAFGGTEGGLTDPAAAAKRLVDVAGYPLSEGYWTKMTINGVEEDVLVQAFQRRILTYRPSEPNPIYQVAWNNAGQDAYNFKYNNKGAPIATAVPTATIDPKLFETPTAVVTPEATEGTLTLDVTYAHGEAKFYVQDGGAQIKDNNKNNIIAALNDIYDIQQYQGTVNLELISLPAGTLDGSDFYKNGKSVRQGNIGDSNGYTSTWGTTDPEEIIKNNEKTEKVYFAISQDSKYKSNSSIDFGIGKDIIARYGNVPDIASFGDILMSHPELQRAVGWVNGARDPNAVPFKEFPLTP